MTTDRRSYYAKQELPQPAKSSIGSMPSNVRETERRQHCPRRDGSAVEMPVGCASLLPLNRQTGRVHA